MKPITTLLGVSLAALLLLAAPASAEFGLSNVEATFTNEDGSVATQAGSHPFALRSSFEVNSVEGPFGLIPEEMPKAVQFSFYPGFIGDLEAVPPCETADFLNVLGSVEFHGVIVNTGRHFAACDDSSVIGHVNVEVTEHGNPVDFTSALYYLEAPPGVAAKIGFWTFGIPTTVNIGVSEEPPYPVTAGAVGLSQALEVLRADLIVWGVPADTAHDSERGVCLVALKDFPQLKDKTCPASVAPKPFLTMPRACEGPLTGTWSAVSWLHPETSVEGPFQALDDLGSPKGMSGCAKVGYTPRMESKPTTSSAESGSGLDFNLDFTDEGIKSAKGIAESDTKEALITMPEGLTINPSIGEGLGVCSPSDLKREKLRSNPGEGCPQPSKIGTLHVTSPVTDEAVDGDIFLAQQDDAATTQKGAENPFDSLIALYFVLRNEELGVLIKQPVKVEPDPNTGRLIATLKDAPQFPIGHFNAHLKTGARAALITPGACGTYTTKATLTPWANQAEPVTTTASFEVTSGVGGGPCPPGGVPPFHPQFQAGAINNNAGSFSPFNMRLIRSDGEQDMTKFSSILPPGELGSLKGVDKCPDSAVTIARAKTGRQELASPSCPANSLIGHTLAGAGVGEALTYVGGQLYLAGPFNGAPLSVISVTPAVAGPFDAGTVVVRLALDLNPKTAEVQVDGSRSDSIPHILKGIVLKVRDLRVYVDRPNFTLNPTSCDESSARSTLFGSYLNVLDPADDVPVGLSTRYQAANCLNLGLKPKLRFQLKGGTRRGDFPALKATYTPRPGDANLEGLTVRLPSSAFLEQGHIRTICTRVQFAAGACPKAAQYGFIKAFTPLLDEPLQGPVYLRSSDHNLPDLVFDLHGLVDVEVSTRIDSKNGGIRASIEGAPDAPISKVELTMQGGRKGLIVNSRDLCAKRSRANVRFLGHNGKALDAKPVMGADCGGKRKSERHHRRSPTR